MEKLIKIILFSMVLGLVAGFQSAHAVAKLKLSDGNPLNDIVIIDGGVGDTNAAVGSVGYNGMIGYFNVNVSTGLTYPILGSLAYPEIDLYSNYITTTGLGGSLVISFTETGFGPLGASSFKTMAGGTTGGAVAFNTYVDNSNAEFGMGTEIGSLGPYIKGAYNGNVVTGVSAENPFSMTAVATVHHSGPASTAFDLNVVAAPEPVSSVLFLAGSAALGIRRLRQKRV